MYVYNTEMFCVILLILFDSQVVSLTGEKIGKISKQWSGLAREIFTDADFFGINFPLDLDVRMKAVHVSFNYFKNLNHSLLLRMVIDEYYFCRRLDEYTYRNSELSARIGVPYDYRPAFS